MTKKILWRLLSIFILIQFVSPARNESNVTEPDDIFKNYPATDNIKALIKTSCYDFIQTIQGNWTFRSIPGIYGTSKGTSSFRAYRPKFTF